MNTEKLIQSLEKSNLEMKNLINELSDENNTNLAKDVISSLQSSLQTQAKWITMLEKQL
ncbi:MAG: hypothetical protein ACK5WP_09410 [Neisseriaceae bacterium]|jgi:hypothetical protein